VFASAGLPVEGIGILMALDLVPDIFKTISNVTGDMAAAVVLSRKHRAGDTPKHSSQKSDPAVAAPVSGNPTALSRDAGELDQPPL
jgi:Na+/H+-dicarboxylate symporter